MSADDVPWQTLTWAQYYMETLRWGQRHSGWTFVRVVIGVVVSLCWLMLLLLLSVAMAVLRERLHMRAVLVWHLRNRRATKMNQLLSQQHWIVLSMRSLLSSPDLRLVGPFFFPSILRSPLPVIVDMLHTIDGVCFFYS